MQVTLNPQAEQQIQRELDRGHYREPADVIARALDLLQHMPYIHLSQADHTKHSPGQYLYTD